MREPTQDSTHVEAVDMTVSSEIRRSIDPRILAAVVGVAITVGTVELWSWPGAWLVWLLRQWGMA